MLAVEFFEKGSQPYKRIMKNPKFVSLWDLLVKSSYADEHSFISQFTIYLISRKGKRFVEEIENQCHLLWS
jgi:hypothetical protein